MTSIVLIWPIISACVCRDDQFEDELELLAETDTYIADQSRLSCQLTYESSCGGATVTIAPE